MSEQTEQPEQTQQSKQIIYIKGNAATPHMAPDQQGIIAHICNDHGAWGAGFVLALSKQSTAPESMYRMWYEGYYNSVNQFIGGNILLTPYYSKHLRVANMIAQHGIGSRFDGQRPLRLTWLATCLQKLSKAATVLNAAVHMPRIGCGLAGGNWDEVGALVQRILCEHGHNVFVYDL